MQASRCLPVSRQSARPSSRGGATASAHASHHSMAGPAPMPTTIDRRALLSGLMASVAMLSDAREAQAYARSSAQCILQDDEETAEACRQFEIGRDQQQSYSSAKASTKTGSAVNGVPVADLGSEYIKSSVALMDLITQYCTLDAYDKQRIAVAKQLKGDANVWVSKYARGGSARSESARKLYIAADGVVGFIASNGLAPYPKLKGEATLAAVASAKSYLDVGK